MSGNVPSPDPERESLPMLEPGGGWISGPMQGNPEQWAQATANAIVVPPRTECPAEPVEPADEYTGNVIVGFAVAELRRYGADLTQSTARILLDFWRFRSEVSDGEVDAIVGRFPVDGER